MASLVSPAVSRALTSSLKATTRNFEGQASAKHPLSHQIHIGLCMARLWLSFPDTMH